MSHRPHGQSLWSALLLLGLTAVALPARATYLELYSADPTSFLQMTGGTASVTYTARVGGLANDDVISSYDIGIIYNQALLRLQSFAFDAGNWLGDPDQFEVVNAGPWDSPNSTWDWRDNSSVNHPDPSPKQTYTGDTSNLGTPFTDTYDPEGYLMQGSLRIAAFSYLLLSELQSKQGADPNRVIPLFQMTFAVDLSQPGWTPVNIVYSNDYSPQDGDFMDVKLNDGSTAQYPERRNGEIIVAAPIPGPLLLMLPGLVLLRRRRAG